MANDIQDQINRVREFATEQAARAGDKVRSGTRKARAAATDINSNLEGARTRANHVVGEANRIITEHPIAATAAAVAAGAVAAYLFPRATRTVTRNAPQIAKIAIKAARAAQDRLPDADDLRKPIHAAAEEVSRAAKTAGDAASKAAKAGIATTIAASDKAARLATEATATASRSGKEAAATLRTKASRLAQESGDAAREALNATRDAVAKAPLADQAAALLEKLSDGAAVAARRVRELGKSLPPKS